MEKLIRELKELQDREDLTGNKIVGAVLAAAVRIRQLLEERSLALQALAASVAMQPGIDAEKLHADFLEIVKAHFRPARSIPLELKDMAAAIELAAAEKK
ncbi:MAG TPA: hypothetical protein VLY46_00675 [Usitatibacter sp.]|nr:hypothetical protein [Usitatibacter sp.]